MKNRPTMETKGLTSLIELVMAVAALNWLEKIPCAENTIGNSTQIKNIPKITSGSEPKEGRNISKDEIRHIAGMDRNNKAANRISDNTMHCTIWAGICLSKDFLSSALVTPAIREKYKLPTTRPNNDKAIINQKAEVADCNSTICIPPRGFCWTPL